MLLARGVAAHGGCSFHALWLSLQAPIRKWAPGQEPVFSQVLRTASLSPEEREIGRTYP